MLYHAVNHAFMKSLLFLGTGAVLHATGERNLGRLGGLIHRMPWVAWLDAGRRARDRGAAAAQRLRFRVAAAAGFPVGARSAAAVRQHAAAARRGGRRAGRGAGRLRDGEVLRRGLPRPAARGGARRAHDAGWLERVGLVWLARAACCSACCPSQVIALLGIVPAQFGFAALGADSVELVACSSRSAERQAAYAPLVFLLAIVATIVLTVLW